MPDEKRRIKTENEQRKTLKIITKRRKIREILK